MIKFLPLGGADEIGASSFYLNINGTGILLDCGIHPRKKGFDALPKFDLIDNEPLDFVFISHAHQDHIGSLPFLIQRFPHVIIYATTQTKEIAGLVLHNAANILASEKDYENQFKIYTHEEVDLLIQSIREIEYEKGIEVKGLRHFSESKIKISFHDAGHILGAAAILIEYSGYRIFYTGDFNLSNQAIMKGANLKHIKHINTLILESTYASTDSAKISSWNSELERFTRSANHILNNGGSILIPVFALGKTQEILASIYLAMKKGKLTETNIFTGGIGRDISNLYDKNRYIVRRKNPDLVLKNIPQLNLFEIDDYNYFKKNNGVVLASSGMMLVGTPSFKLLDYWLGQKSFGIFGVGYFDPQTPGFTVMSSKKGDTVKLTEFGQQKKIMCHIERFYFPSHSKREELLSIVEETRADKVILIHGDHSAKDWLGFHLLDRFFFVKVHSAEIGREIMLS